MKYPVNQFRTLVEVLKQLSVLMDLTSVHPCALHYIVYQQFSPGQQHNHLWSTVNGLKRFYQLTEEEKQDARKLIELKPENEFMLYPDGCNDNHVETAVKRALKELSITK